MTTRTLCVCYVSIWFLWHAGLKKKKSSFRVLLSLSLSFTPVGSHRNWNVACQLWKRQCSCVCRSAGHTWPPLTSQLHPPMRLGKEREREGHVHKMSTANQSEFNLISIWIDAIVVSKTPVISFSHPLKTRWWKNLLLIKVHQHWDDASLYVRQRMDFAREIHSLLWPAVNGNIVKGKGNQVKDDDDDDDDALALLLSSCWRMHVDPGRDRAFRPHWHDGVKS